MPNETLIWVAYGACWLLGVNSLAVIAFHHDKRMARLGGWRIPEQTLLTLALVGGSPGALLARSVFRHKTRKQPFSGQLLAIFGLHFFTLAALGMYGLQELVAPWVR